MVDIVNEQKKRIRYMYTWMFRRYKKNVVADSVYSAVRSDSVTTDYLKVCQANRMDKSIRFGWLGEAGSKIESGRVSKLYSLDFNNYQNNATQATSTSRPFFCGNIAPNEKLGIKNPNGGSNFMTHPTISFAANESWSVTTVLKPFGFSTTQTFIVGGTNTKVRFTTLGKLEIVNESNTTATGTFLYHKYVGKNTCIHLVAAGNGTIIVYANNVPVETITITSNLSFTQENTITSPFYGCLYGDLRRAQALTPTQVTAEYTYLRSVYPEIESVEIGTQTWSSSNCEMAATPMGNVIANVTDNTIWASSQTLYDNAWNAAGGAAGGAAAIYAGVKAAAMWCHYNNDVAKGAVYGKLYNWFAIKLLQMDIDYYNTANPTALWGWRVPTQADFQTLSTYLGGDAVSGGKLKLAGTTYWNSPNTDADNSSGFSALGGGYKNEVSGASNAMFIESSIWGVNKSRLSINYNLESITYGDFSPFIKRGMAIRLIKA